MPDPISPPPTTPIRWIFTLVHLSPAPCRVGY
jgi:hypothetical protein